MYRRAFFSSLLAACTAALFLSPAAAQSPEGSEAGIPAGEITEPIVATSAEIELAPGPPSLPAGARFAVLEGDPTKAVPLTFRLWFPADYQVPPHWHSVLEHVTVVEGTLHIGMGEEATYEGGVALSEGDFGALPRRMVHYAWTEDRPVLFQLHSNGPWSITYVDPDDDPRKR